MKSNQIDLFGHPFAFLGVTDCRNVIVSFSGGRSSAFMAKTMKNDAYWAGKNLVFVYANTGKEKPQTLDFVDRCDREFNLGLIWVESVVDPVMGNGTTHKIVNYLTASRHGEPFEAVTAKYGISNTAFPHCSRELKKRPINSYAVELFGGNHVTALGIRADEIKRLRKSEEFVYPLAAWSITTEEIREYWKSSSFDLQLADYEGNCDLCWKKSTRKLLTIIKENPSITDWWAEMESKYSMLQVSGREDNHGAFWNRNNMPIPDLVAMANEPFIPATDPHFTPNQEMDEESHCQCFRQDTEASAID